VMFVSVENAWDVQCRRTIRMEMVVSAIII
jgi:hypothetical protein